MERRWQSRRTLRQEMPPALLCPPRSALAVRHVSLLVLQLFWHIDRLQIVIHLQLPRLDTSVGGHYQMLRPFPSPGQIWYAGQVTDDRFRNKYARRGGHCTGRFRHW